jgi:DNA-binding CsgD family transcriptional regulator
MVREARLGGDVSRPHARRPLEGGLAGPEGGLRALASHAPRDGAQEQASAEVALSGPLLHAVHPGPGACVSDASSGGGQPRAYREAADFSVSPPHLLANEVWTVVDSYEKDGKRYVVAERSERRAPGPGVLSPRERQALAIAVHGDTNKVIAFKMGISASTVGVFLHRAAQKLGSRTRPELLARFRQLAASGSEAWPQGH